MHCYDFDLVAQVIAVGGRILLTAAPSMAPLLSVTTLYTKDVSLLGFVISRASLGDLTAAAEMINGMLQAGLLTARVSDVLPLSDTADVHARLEAGQIVGRVLLRP